MINEDNPTYPSMSLAIAAADVALVDALIKLGASAHPEADIEGPLYWAITDLEEGSKIVSLLLRRGADANARFLNDWTALHVAAAHNRLNVAGILLSAGADINARTRIDNFDSPIECAGQHGHMELVQFLFDNGADPRLGRESDPRYLNISRDEAFERLLKVNRKALGISHRFRKSRGC